jgi:hypothetical protein
MEVISKISDQKNSLDYHTDQSQHIAKLIIYKSLKAEINIYTDNKYGNLLFLIDFNDFFRNHDKFYRVFV